MKHLSVFENYLNFCLIRDEDTRMTKSTRDWQNYLFQFRFPNATA